MKPFFLILALLLNFASAWAGADYGDPLNDPSSSTNDEDNVGNPSFCEWHLRRIEFNHAGTLRRRAQKNRISVAAQRVLDGQLISREKLRLERLNRSFTYYTDGLGEEDRIPLMKSLAQRLKGLLPKFDLRKPETFVVQNEEEMLHVQAILEAAFLLSAGDFPDRLTTDLKLRGRFIESCLAFMAATLGSAEIASHSLASGIFSFPAILLGVMQIKPLYYRATDATHYSLWNNHSLRVFIDDLRNRPEQGPPSAGKSDDAANLFYLYMAIRVEQRNPADLGYIALFRKILSEEIKVARVSPSDRAEPSESP